VCLFPEEVKEWKKPQKKTTHTIWWQDIDRQLSNYIEEHDSMQECAALHGYV
jgi:hypothetical protein